MSVRIEQLTKDCGRCSGDILRSRECLCGDDRDLDAYTLANTQKQLEANVLTCTTVEAHSREQSTSDGEDSAANHQERSIVADDADQNPTDSGKNGFFWSALHGVGLMGINVNLQEPTISGRFLMPLVAAETPSTDWKKIGM